MRCQRPAKILGVFGGHLPVLLPPLGGTAHHAFTGSVLDEGPSSKVSTEGFREATPWSWGEAGTSPSTARRGEAVVLRSGRQ